MKYSNNLISIQLVFNHGYSWFGNDGSFVKGWAVDNSGEFFEDAKLLSIVQPVKSYQELKQLVDNISGHFSIIKVSEEGLVAGVDRCRTFPLFYAIHNNSIFLSDSVLLLRDNLFPNETPDGSAVDEYLSAGYVLGDKTLYKPISQIKAGDILHFSDGVINTTPYFRYLTDSILEMNMNQATHQFIQLLDKIFSNLIIGLNGRTAVIPLSGGYDSRLIASMFRRHGYKNVICYSFGKVRNPEMLISERVSRSLGYPWFFFETTPEAVNGFADSESFYQYVDFAANANSFYIIQDFFALRQMTLKKLIPPDAVFMPGHSGDTLGGSNFLEAVNGSESLDQLIGRIVALKLNLRETSSSIKLNFRKSIDAHFKDFYGEQFEWYDGWSMCESHPKLFVNATKVYDFFGYKYYLPLWDNTLLNFFKNLPLELKKNKKLYDSTLEDKVFSPLGVDFSTPKPKLKASILLDTKMFIRRIVKKILPSGIKYRYFSYDPINGRVYSNELRKSMKARGQKMNFNSTNSVKSQWYIWHLSNRLKTKE